MNAQKEFKFFCGMSRAIFTDNIHRYTKHGYASIYPVGKRLYDVWLERRCKMRPDKLAQKNKGTVAEKAKYRKELYELLGWMPIAKLEN